MKAKRHANVCASASSPLVEPVGRDVAFTVVNASTRRITKNSVVKPLISSKEERNEVELPSYRATELPSYRATELPSYSATSRLEDRHDSRNRSAHAPRSRHHLAWLLVLGFSGLCLAAANLASGQLTPPESAYEWNGPIHDPLHLDPIDDPDATDAANWLAPDGSEPLPTEGAHLLFGNRSVDGARNYDSTLTGFGDSPLPTRFGSLWFGFGELDDYLSYTLTGSAITVGYGTEEIDRLIVASSSWDNYTLDLDILIHDVPGLGFRIVNNSSSEWASLDFARTLTSTGTLIVDGYGRTLINELHGSGALIKEGTGTLTVDSTNFAGAVTIRGGALVGALSDDSALTLAGGIYGFDSNFERTLGTGAGEIRWLADKSGGFGAFDDAWVDLTLDGGRTLTWGEEHFVSLGSELLFGSERAEGDLRWYNALDLGDPLDDSVRTIRVEGKTEYWDGMPLFRLHLGEELIAAEGQKLRFIGNGTVVISANNENFHGDLEIAGVALSLADGGRFGEVGHITVRDGGTLAVTIGWGETLSPLAHEADITLHSATLRWEDYSELERKLGDIALTGGAHAIERISAVTPLRAKSLIRNGPRSTLHVALIDNYSPGSSIMAFDDTTAHESTAIEGILPWLVVTVGSHSWDKRSDWGIFEDGGLKPYANYYEGSEDTWEAGHNVNVPNNGYPPDLSADRTINSLRLASFVGLEGHTLTIGSGGILVGTDVHTGSLYDNVGTSTITTAAGRPLYAQVHSTEFYINARLTGGMDLVKAGGGKLSLESANDETGHTNDLGSIYIHEGELHLTGGARIASTGTITVGDGGHRATLSLENARYWEPGDAPILSGKRDIRLRGGHGTGEATAATLRLVGEHDLRLNHLSIEGNSVLAFDLPSWSGGTSKIYSEVFTIDPAGRLLVVGWDQKEGTEENLWNEVGSADRFTHILVRKTSPGLDEHLTRVWFQDYGPAKKIDWVEDNRYWEIVPGAWNGWDSGSTCPPDNPNCPEPSTYGAILGAVGIGLVVWRRRRKSDHLRPLKIK